MRQATLRIGGCILLTLAGALCGTTEARAEMRFIAHRGESADAPENTLAAFQLALDRGADGFECDVWLTKDKRLACIHDGSTTRVTTPSTNLSVTASTLAELRALDVGSWKGPAFAGEKIPTLEETLALARDGFRIYVEIKEEAVSGVIPYVAAAVRAEPKATAERIVFISFKASSIASIRAEMPDYEACWLSYYSSYAGNPSSLVTQLQQMNASGFSGGYSSTALPDVLAALRAAGFSAHVWTVDAADQAIACAALGIDSLTSNRARQMLDNVCGEAVPRAWLDAYPALLAQHGGIYREAAMAATGKLDPRGREMRVWEDYVAGTSPDDPASRFRCFVVAVADGAPRVSWTPDLGAARRYTVYGKTNLSDIAWITPTNGATRFFKVDASLP